MAVCVSNSTSLTQIYWILLEFSVQQRGLGRQSWMGRYVWGEVNQVNVTQSGSRAVITGQCWPHHKAYVSSAQPPSHDGNICAPCDRTPENHVAIPKLLRKSPLGTLRSQDCGRHDNCIANSVQLTKNGGVCVSMMFTADLPAREWIIGCSEDRNQS